MKKSESLIALGIWLIVVVTSIFYILYFRRIESITEIIVSVAPAIIFFSGGILIFTRDKKIIRKAKESEEFTKTTELNWGQALRHDLLTYFVPVLILAFPFVMGQQPGFIDLCQAVFVFLAFNYLKINYWGEL